MRIGEGLTPGPVDPAESKVRNASPTSNSTEGAATAQTSLGDIVRLGRGKELLELASELSALSRKTRVEEIRQRLVTGDYEVSSKDVSRAIVEDMITRAVRHGVTG